MADETFAAVIEGMHGIIDDLANEDAFLICTVSIILS